MLGLQRPRLPPARLPVPWSAPPDWPDRFAGSWPAPRAAFAAPPVPRATAPAPASAGPAPAPVRRAGPPAPPPVSRRPRADRTRLERFGQRLHFLGHARVLGFRLRYRRLRRLPIPWSAPPGWPDRLCWLLACASSRFCCSASSARNCSCACVRWASSRSSSARRAASSAACFSAAPRRPDSLFSDSAQRLHFLGHVRVLGFDFRYRPCAAANSLVCAARLACSVCWLLACASNRFCCSASSARNCSCACVRWASSRSSSARRAASSAACFSAAPRRPDSLLQRFGQRLHFLGHARVLGLQLRYRRLRGGQFLGPRRQSWPDRFAGSWPAPRAAFAAPPAPRAIAPAPASAGPAPAPVRPAGPQAPPPVSRRPRADRTRSSAIRPASALPGHACVLGFDFGYRRLRGCQFLCPRRQAGLIGLLALGLRLQPRLLLRQFRPQFLLRLRELGQFPLQFGAPGRQFRRLFLGGRAPARLASCKRFGQRSAPAWPRSRAGLSSSVTAACAAANSFVRAARLA